MGEGAEVAVAASARPNHVGKGRALREPQQWLLIHIPTVRYGAFKQ